jgi:hypothetical protein
MILINKVILLTSNFVLLTYLVMLMMNHYRANYNMRSWSTLFHILCVAWLSIRGLFWLWTVVSVTEWSAIAFHSLYWMPNAFEFAAFSLLPMFFAQLIYAAEWKKYWKVVKPIYIIFICTICVLQILWAIMAGLNTKCVGTDITGMHPVATNHDVIQAISLNPPPHLHMGATVSSQQQQQQQQQQQHPQLDIYNAADAALHTPTPRALRSSSRDEVAALKTEAEEGDSRSSSRDGDGDGDFEEGSSDTSTDREREREREVEEEQERRREAAEKRRRRKHSPHIYYEDCYSTDVSSAASRLVAALLFVLLATIQAFYGYKILHLPMQQYAQHFTAPPFLMNILNAVLTICFGTRGLYLLGTLLGFDVLPAIPLQADEDVTLRVLFCFELWDYIPILLLLLSVTSRPLGSGSGVFGSSLPGYQSVEDATDESMDNISEFDSFSVSEEGVGLEGCGERGNLGGMGGDGGGWLGSIITSLPGYGSIAGGSSARDRLRSGSGDGSMSGGNMDGTRMAELRSMGGRSRSGSNATSRGRSGTFDRQSRGLGGATRALDQLEIEIQSDHMGAGGAGSLERFTVRILFYFLLFCFS